MTILGYIVGAIGAFLVLLNYSVVLKNYRNRRLGLDRHQSFIPILGGVLSAIGYYQVTGNGLSLLIALIDPGCFVLLLIPFALLKQKFGQRE